MAMSLRKTRAASRGSAPRTPPCPPPGAGPAHPCHAPPHQGSAPPPSPGPPTTIMPRPQPRPPGPGALSASACPQPLGPRARLASLPGRRRDRGSFPLVGVRQRRRRRRPGRGAEGRTDARAGGREPWSAAPGPGGAGRRGECLAGASAAARGDLSATCGRLGRWACPRGRDSQVGRPRDSSLLGRPRSGL